MRTIQCQKRDKACIVVDAFGNEYFRQGNHVATPPCKAYPSGNNPNVDVEAVEFTADEDVKVDESVYLQDDNNIIFDLIAGPRPKNIKNRK